MKEILRGVNLSKRNVRNSSLDSPVHVLEMPDKDM
jgi:hypothetical protein